MEEYCVYYLYSQKLDKYYIGKTNDLIRRLGEHNTGEENYTKLGKPWKLVAYIKCNDNTEACRLENKLKKTKNRKYVSWYFDTNGTIDNSAGR